jgi:hypothetical protein
MSFTNVALKTRGKNKTGENYIGSFMACSQQIFGSLIKTGRARDTYVVKKNILRVLRRKGMILLQRPGHRMIILRHVIQDSDWDQNRIHLAQDTSFLGMQRLCHGTDQPTSKNVVKERVELYICYSSGPA